MSNWPLVCLGDAVTFRGGGTPRKDVAEYWSDEIPWATVKDFKSLLLTQTQDSISKKGLEASASNLIPAGHVIIPTRMALGKAAINTIDVAINQDLRALVPKLPIDTAYLLHSMLGLADIIERNGSGATVKGITQQRLAGLQIPLPPLSEQKRIAGLLDAADALRAKRREALAQLDTLLQSTFIDMFGDPVTNPMGWETNELADVVQIGTIVTYGIVQAGKEFPGGVPYIRTGDIVDGEIDLSGLRHTDPEIASRFMRSTVRSGEIVMSIRATVGTTALVPLEIDGANLTQGTARISPGDMTNPHFLLHFIRSQGCQRWIQNQIKGATFREITLKRLRQMPVQVPPLTLQRRFAAIVESVERQKARMRAHLAELDALFASLQSRAFSGTL